MSYTMNSKSDKKQMLAEIGVESFEELIESIPQEFRLKEEIDIEEKSELEITKKVAGELSRKNINLNDYTSYLGGGSYDHYIPSIISSLTSRSEYYTAYTPYQAEVSQGTLQTIYEYQTMVCRLFGMEVSNASMYDGATALAEAILLATSYSKKKKVLLASTINPVYKQLIATYTDAFELELVYIDQNEKGLTSYDAFKNAFDENVGAIVIQSPNFYGNIEDVENLADLVHTNKKALFIMSVDPISLGLLKKPASYGADIVVAEGQALGIPQAFGGPYLGLFATTKKLIRAIPGRLVGVTEDAEGKRAFVLTLQTREQHIRRDKATSNICTSQALMALSSTIYMSTMGEEGLKEVAENCYLRAHYLAKEIDKLANFKLKYKDAPFFKEFVIETKQESKVIIEKMLAKGIFAGIAMDKFGGSKNEMLIAVTEKRDKEELDYFVKCLQEI